MRFNWWLTHESIKYILLIAIVLILSYFDIIWVLWIVFGIIPLFFNRQTYEYMVKYSFWLSRKVGGREIAKATRTTIYRTFYRTATFIVGLMFLDLGITGGKVMEFLFNKLGLM